MPWDHEPWLENRLTPYSLSHSMLVFTHIFLAGHRRQRKMPRKSSGKPGRRCCLRRVVPTRPTIARGKSAAFWTFFAGTTVSSQKDMGHVQHRMGEGRGEGPRCCSLSHGLRNK